MALAWLMNLGFGLGGGSPAPPPVTPQPPGGGGHRRGSIWEPRVDLVIREAQQRRELARLQEQEAHLQRQLVAPKQKAQKHRLSPAQVERVRAAITALGTARQQKQTELDEILQRILEFDREIERQAREEKTARTLRELHAANAQAAREHQARKAAEIERRVAVQIQLEMSRKEAIRVEAVRVAAAKALEARKRDEEAIAIALWMAMFDD